MIICPCKFSTIAVLHMRVDVICCDLSRDMKRVALFVNPFFVHHLVEIFYIFLQSNLLHLKYDYFCQL